MTRGEPSAGDLMVTQARALVHKVEQHARGCGRDDLAEALEAELPRSEEERVTVVVCGESNRGKSSLVNALLDRPALLPVGAQTTTATHVLVRQRRDGEAEHATAHLGADQGAGVSLEELDDWVTQDGGGAARRSASHVEVALDHPMLAHGVVLVDTPGVGGLERAHGELARAALRMASAVILVVDAGAPLTSVELTVLGEAMERVGVVLLVLNRVDVHPGWEDVRREDEQLLAAMAGDGRAVPTIAPASTRMKAKADRLAAGAQHADPLIADLRRDSGIVALQELLTGWARDRSSQLRTVNLCRLVQVTLEHLATPDHTMVETAHESPEQLTEQLQRAQEAASDLDAEAKRLRQWLGDEMMLLQRETDGGVRSSCAGLEREYQLRVSENRVDGLWDDLEAALYRLQEELITNAAGGVERLRGALVGFLSEQDARLEGRGAGFEHRAALGLASAEQPGAPGPSLMGQVTRMSPLLASPIAIGVGTSALAAAPVAALAAVAIGAMVTQHRRSTQRHEITQRLKETLQGVSTELPPVLARSLQEARRALEQELEEGARREVGLLREQAKQLQAQIAMTRSQRAAGRQEAEDRLKGHREMATQVARLQHAAAGALEAARV